MDDDMHQNNSMISFEFKTDNCRIQNFVKSEDFVCCILMAFVRIFWMHRHTFKIAFASTLMSLDPQFDMVQLNIL